MSHILNFSSIESNASSTLKSDINDILSLTKEEQLQLIKKNDISRIVISVYGDQVCAGVVFYEQAVCEYAVCKVYDNV